MLRSVVGSPCERREVMSFKEKSIETILHTISLFETKSHNLHSPILTKLCKIEIEVYDLHPPTTERVQKKKESIRWSRGHQDWHGSIDDKDKEYLHTNKNNHRLRGNDKLCNCNLKGTSLMTILKRRTTLELTILFLRL